MQYTLYRIRTVISMSFSRRKFFTLAGATFAGVTMVSPLEAFYARVARGQAVRSTGYGPLQPKLPENATELTNTILGDLSSTPLLELPSGFTYRAFSITGQPMSDGFPVREVTMEWRRFQVLGTRLF